MGIVLGTGYLGYDYFTGNAQVLKKLEVTQASLENNAKIILTEKGITPNIILGEIPVRQKE